MGEMLKSLFSLAISFFVISFVSFALLHYSQGSVAFAFSPQAISPSLRAKIESNLDLDKPLVIQYGNWLMRVIKGDLSLSLISGESVSAILKERLPYTLILGGSAFVLLIVLSIIFALLCLVNPFLDRCITFLGIGFSALPTFSLALLLILFLSAKWTLFPSSGVSEIGAEDDLIDRLRHLVLPVSALVISHLGFFTQFVRSTLSESLNHGFISFGLARGLSPIFIYRTWVLKYSLSPIIAYFASSFVSFLASTYVVEGVFGYGGIGETLISSLIFKDYPVVLAVLVLSFLAVVIVDCVAKYMCAVLNRGRV